MDTRTRRRTNQLIESIGPEGQCFENLANKVHVPSTANSASKANTANTAFTAITAITSNKANTAKTANTINTANKSQHSQYIIFSWNKLDGLVTVGTFSCFHSFLPSWQK